MIKKNAHEDRTDNDARTIHQELMAHAIKLLGSEERARAMLAAGTLHLLVPKERRELDSRVEALWRLRAFDRETLPSPRQRPWRPLQAAWRREYWSQDRTRKAAVAGSHEASLVPQARRGNLTGQSWGKIPNGSRPILGSFRSGGKSERLDFSHRRFLAGAVR